MAIKDWKKNYAVNIPSWKNDKTMGRIYIDKYSDGDYAVKIYKHYSTFAEEKLFKTKSQALKFAKSYMRKH